MLPPTFTLWQRRPLVQGIEARGRHAGRHIEERISGTSVARFAARIFVHYRECDRGMGMTGYGSTPYKRRHASARIIAIHASTYGIMPQALGITKRMPLNALRNCLRRYRARLSCHSCLKPRSSVQT